jgi:hypothetical protein
MVDALLIDVPLSTKRMNWSNAVLLKNLPDDFLRITEPEEDFDELALMLQNEEFLNQLRF